jgi:hypothetical protein
MEKQDKDYSHIKGWGVDANDDNEPTYPIKDYTGDDHNRLKWNRPELQEQKEEVLQSNERPYTEYDGCIWHSVTSIRIKRSVT